MPASGKVHFHPTSAAENAELRSNAEIAQLVEHNLAKVGVASSSLVFRSLVKTAFRCLFCFSSVGRPYKISVSESLINYYCIIVAN